MHTLRDLCRNGAEIGTRAGSVLWKMIDSGSKSGSGTAAVPRDFGSDQSGCIAISRRLSSKIVFLARWCNVLSLFLICTGSLSPPILLEISVHRGPYWSYSLRSLWSSSGVNSRKRLSTGASAGVMWDDRSWLILAPPTEMTIWSRRVKSFVNRSIVSKETDSHCRNTIFRMATSRRLCEFIDGILKRSRR